MNPEDYKDLIGKKASTVYENYFMTIKEIKQFKDMLLVYFEENNYVCNIQILKLEDGSRIIKL
jgi:hypothetical protein